MSTFAIDRVLAEAPAPEHRAYNQWVGFSDESVDGVARQINAWLLDHPRWYVSTVQFSTCPYDDMTWASALVEMKVEP